MVLTTPPSKGKRCRKRKRETDEASPSADAVSEINLTETAHMILARGKTAAYKSGSAPRRLTEVLRKIEAPTTPGTDNDFKPPLKTNVKRGSTSGQTWSSGHLQAVDFDATPGYWEQSDVLSSGEKCDNNYRSALVDSSRDHERTGELPEGA